MRSNKAISICDAFILIANWCIKRTMLHSICVFFVWFWRYL